MKVIRFSAMVQIIGVNPYVIVSSDKAAALAPSWKKPMPVLATVNGQPAIPWKINLMPIGNGDFYLYLHGDLRKASKAKVGDTVRVMLSFNTDYRNGPQDPMPLWFANALGKSQGAKRNWELLTPSRKKEILRYFARLKSQEAKERNLKRVLHVLEGNQSRFMGKLWNNGK